MEPISQLLAPDYGPPPDSPAWMPIQPPTAPTPKPRRSRLKTALGGIALARLLVVGGAATVFAAHAPPPPGRIPRATPPPAGRRGAPPCPLQPSRPNSRS